MYVLLSLFCQFDETDTDVTSLLLNYPIELAASDLVARYTLATRRVTLDADTG